MGGWERRDHGILSARKRRNGDFVKTAGLAIVKQTPGTAKGTVFMSVSDETDIFNVIVTKEFFELMLQNTMEGFFADPLYGGNRGMVSWKMIGFPGARYDYRAYVTKHNQPYPFGPVSIYGEDSWKAKS